MEDSENELLWLMSCILKLDKFAWLRKKISKYDTFYQSLREKEREREKKQASRILEFYGNRA
ncbi:hypothetical protein BpHYR1_010710 [Brachionus plicatilis]|uniref:Uncharacterized protein n=1 Tax=Brachionus plicatilis TaxID=10195 RepID=A0A3M7SKR8_BRAPC|nr:hypothetical protein BpHYR1_010710 [Brachionus plicatilis]